jgi:hypothetical protein
MRHISRKKLAVVVVFPVVLVYMILVVAGLRGWTYGLRADLIVLKGKQAIPGISKTYEAELVNRALWPVRVTRCEFTGDGSQSDPQSHSRLAYSVERGDPDGGPIWITVVADSAADFCKPAPGMPDAHLVEALLWPGQKLLSGDEAAAAEEDFNLGDRARFVLYAGVVGESAAAVATPEFTIDEHPTAAQAQSSAH